MNDQAPFDRTLTGDAAEASMSPTIDSPPVLTPMETIAGPSQHGGAAAVTLVAEEYVVGREIARGGMGCVLAAEDRKLGRVVAMKVMRLESAASE
jgi:serine/threonine protein kinase